MENVASISRKKLSQSNNNPMYVYNPNPRKRWYVESFITLKALNVLKVLSRSKEPNKSKALKLRKWSIHWERGTNVLDTSNVLNTLNMFKTLKMLKVNNTFDFETQFGQWTQVSTRRQKRWKVVRRFSKHVQYFKHIEHVEHIKLVSVKHIEYIERIGLVEQCLTHMWWTRNSFWVWGPVWAVESSFD